MQVILDFITTNYLWFIIIAIILLLALIGYFVDVKKAENGGPYRNKKVKVDIVADTDLDNINVANNMSLNEMINNKAITNNDFITQKTDERPNEHKEQL